MHAEVGGSLSISLVVGIILGLFKCFGFFLCCSCSVNVGRNLELGSIKLLHLACAIKQRIEADPKLLLL